MKKDVLFLCQFFYPETVSSATLPFDTASFLAKNGFSVGALCSYPKEYGDGQKAPKREIADGVQIRRVKHLQLKRIGKLGRLINYFSFTFSVLFHMREMKDYKCVVVYSNPPILPAVARLAKKKYGTKIVFVAYDLYPEIAYASGSIRRGNVIDRVMKRINEKLFPNVDRVVALTDEMKQFLLENRQGLHPEQIITIPNWAHEKETVIADGAAYKRFGYSEGQFVVSYFGNMGTCQDVDTLLQAARLLKEDERIRFLMIGHGNKMPRVQQFVQENGLKNLQVMNYLTGVDFERAVAISSCCVISLENGLKGMCAPSKYYSYLQGGNPILAVIAEDSYLAEEVRCEHLGYSVNVGDAERLRDAILSLLESPEERLQMGLRARTLYEDKYAMPHAMEAYRAFIKELCVN